jgi:hypothetical protein
MSKRSKKVIVTLRPAPRFKLVDGRVTPAATHERNTFGIARAANVSGESRRTLWRVWEAHFGKIEGNTCPPAGPPSRRDLLAAAKSLLQQQASITLELGGILMALEVTP